MNIYDWDQGADGTVGLSGSAIDAEGRYSGFVAWISSDGNRSLVIRTLLYRPAWVAVAPDGTLWTSGRELIIPTSTALVPDAGVIRHFDQSGRIMASFVPQSTIDNPLALSNPRSWLRISGGRVAWYMAGGRYIEISLIDGTLTDIRTIPPVDKPTGDVTGVALSDDGEVFLSAERNPDSTGIRVQGIYTLDRVSGTWKLLVQRGVKTGAPPNPDDLGFIYGVDGNRLVLNGRQQLKFFDIIN